MNVRIDVQPLRFTGAPAHLEDHILLPIDIFLDNLGTRVECAPALVNKMGIFGVLGYVLTRLEPTL